MSTLDIIRAEPRRQDDETRGGGIYFDDSDPADAIVDGHVDLVALASPRPVGPPRFISAANLLIRKMKRRPPQNR